MKRIYIIIILFFLMQLCNAQQKVKIGELYYQLLDGTATLSGDIDEDVYETPRYSNIHGAIIIPEVINYEGQEYIVESIGTRAFERCYGLTEVKMPNSIKTIEISAFEECKALFNIEFSNSLTTINAWAFSGCSGLTDIVIPNSVNTITSSVFLDCINLENVKLSDNLSEIGFQCFQGCSKLKEIIVPKGISKIPMFTFLGCTNLSTIEMPNSLISIGYEAFSKCNSLTNIDIPVSVKSIQSSAFSNCLNLEKVNINSLESWCDIDFDDSTANPLSIAHHLFINDEEIIELTIPESITKIKDYTFQGGIAFTKIILPSSLTSIGKGAFCDCWSLREIDIPSKVTEIGDEAFYQCTDLTAVKNTDSIVKLGNGVFTNCSSLKNFNIPSSVTFLPSRIFSGCSSLTDVVLPSSITSIGQRAFRYCKNLKSFYIPKSVTTIHEEAFEGCYGLIKTAYPDNLTNPFYNGFNIAYPAAHSIIENGIIYDDDKTKIYYADLNFEGELDIYDSVISIGDYAFYSCSGLKGINFPVSLKSIGIKTFTSTSIKELKLPENIESIGLNSFTNCPIEKLNVFTNAPLDDIFTLNAIREVTFANYIEAIPSFNGAVLLKDIKLPESLIALPDYAFSMCISLEEINIPESLKYLGIGSFSNCQNLTRIHLPDGVSSIPPYSFYNCRSLEKFKYSNNINFIGENAFYDCFSLKNITIPEGISTISNYAFSGCSTLTEINFPNSITNIGEAAFYGCSSLRNLSFGTDLYAIGNYAFYGCENIKEIYCFAKNPPYAEQNTFPLKTYTNAIVTVKEMSLETYKRENPWYRFENYLTVAGSVSLSHYNVDLAGNEVFQLGVYGSDSKIYWESSNPSIAYINECGLIVAMGKTGSTVISASVDGEEFYCNVIVTTPYRNLQTLTRVNSDNDNQPVEIIIDGISGNPPMINVRLIPVGAKTIIDWNSSNSNLASVENGLIYVHANGEVDFDVETENGLSESIGFNTQNIDQSYIEQIIDKSNMNEEIQIYDLSGKIIYHNATKDQIKNLSKGIYIIVSGKDRYKISI